MRAAVVIVMGDSVALIERRRSGHTYYLLPGGGVDAAETPEAAAAREALEELGLEVIVQRLIAEVEFAGHPQLYFLAEVQGGEFGTGKGTEMASPAESPTGSYSPRWIPIEELACLDVRPRGLARAIALGVRRDWPDMPLRLGESGESVH